MITVENIQALVEHPLTKRILSARGEDLDKEAYRFAVPRMDSDTDESFRARILKEYAKVKELTKNEPSIHESDK